MWFHVQRRSMEGSREKLACGNLNITVVNVDMWMVAVLEDVLVG